MALINQLRSFGRLQAGRSVSHTEETNNGKNDGWPIDIAYDRDTSYLRYILVADGQLSEDRVTSLLAALHTEHGRHHAKPWPPPCQVY